MRVRSLKLLHCLKLAFAVFSSLVGAAFAHAQTAGTGTIQGRVYNPTTQQYIRNAEVRLEGSNHVAETGSDGSFTLHNVPAGQATIVVSYSGYGTAREVLTVSAGQIATREINLTAVDAAPGAKKDEVIQLQVFTVASEREGNAKAIAEQKRNMNVVTSVASDVFGDVADGNVGEFLKYLPGVDVDYVESETRGPRLGGMDAQYTAVSFDGVRLASADANRTGDLGRATSFEAFSISSIESIEIHRTTSSDMDADAPAGTINMRTRRAFDRKGRRISYNTGVNFNSEEFHLQKNYGPGANREYKARFNGSFEYSDVFLDNRLGLVLSVNHVDSYTEQYRHNITYNSTLETALPAGATGPIDTRPMVITALNFKDGNKNIGKDTISFTTDFKVTPRLVLSGIYIYNYALGQFYNREFTFNAANNNSSATTGRRTVAGDGLNTVRGVTATSNSALGGGSASKRTHTVTVAPKFEYKIGTWTIDGGAGWSRSRNDYEALEKGHTRSDDVNSIASQFVATRSNHTSHEWTVQQVSGADWFDLNNRTNPRVTNEGRYANTELWSGEFNARWVTPIERFPTAIKFGAKWAEDTRHNGNETSYNTWRYIGPGGDTTGSWAFLGANPNTWNTGTTNILTVKNTAGEVGFIPRPDSNKIADLFRERPELFVNIATADNFYNAFIAPRRDMVQTVTAGYGMTDIRFSSKIALRTGLRWEKTENDYTEFDPRTKAEMLAAGYALNTAGRATTIAGYQYQYLSKPRVIRDNDYANFFPMISLKYDINRNLQFHTGFNKAISRPPPDHLTGAWLVNEDTHVVTAPNPNLLPEYSKNFVARLAYYFEPAGNLSLTVNQNDIRNLREQRTNGTAEAFGLGDDPVYSSYTFSSRFNVPNPVRFRSMELAYGQTLPFKTELLRGITVNVAYTRTYASQRRDKLLPHRFTSSLVYRYKRFIGRAGVVWRDDSADTSDNYGRYRRHDAKLDIGGEFKLNRYASLFLQGRNIFNDGQTWMQTPPGSVEGQGAAVRVYENYGANWVFGVKGQF